MIRVWSSHSDHGLTPSRTLIMDYTPPHTLIMDYTMTQVWVFTLTPYGSTHEYKTFGWCSWPRCGFQGSDQNQNQALQKFVLESPGPYCIYPLSRGHYWTDVWRIYPFSIFHVHRETSVLSYELPEESDQFRFLHALCFANLKGAVGLIMVKVSVMRISIPLDLSCRSCIPLPRFIRSRRPTPFLTPSLVLFPPCSV